MWTQGKLPQSLFFDFVDDSAESTVDSARNLASIIFIRLNSRSFQPKLCAGIFACPCLHNVSRSNTLAEPSAAATRHLTNVFPAQIITISNDSNISILCEPNVDPSTKIRWHYNSTRVLTCNQLTSVDELFSRFNKDRLLTDNVD
jgi:hypothetical protein